MPGVGGEHAGAAGCTAVVVAEPDGGGELGDRADEPQIPSGFGGAGLAGHGAILEGSAAARAPLHHLLLHPEHGVGQGAGHGPAAAVAINAAAPEQVAIGAEDFLKRRRRHVNAPVGDRRVGRRHVEHGLLVGADRHRVEAPQGPGDAQAAGRGDHRVKAHLLQQPHRHHVEGVLHRHPHRNGPHEAVAEVFRAIASKTARFIHHDVLGLHALFEGRKIHKQLEGGAGGAQGLDGPVELALVVVLAAHQGPHQAGARLHRNQGPLHGARGVGIDDRLGLVLPGQIEAAADR